jgi:DNA-binding MarR family transcriptional regulator
MLRFQDLARVAGISESGASRRLNQMIKAGLIDRHVCASDRRGVYAHLTAKGKSVYEKGHTVFLRSLDRNLAPHLEPGEADLVRAALARLG